LHFNYSELFIKTADTSNKRINISIVGIFSPSGGPISLQNLRCGLLAVVHYSFEGYCLAFAATSARE